MEDEERRRQGHTARGIEPGRQTGRDKTAREREKGATLSSAQTRG